MVDVDVDKSVSGFPAFEQARSAGFLGSHNAKTGTWMWAWANDSIDPRLKADSMALREVGELLGHQTFTERILIVSGEDPDCLALLALERSRHDALYKAPDGEHVTFLSFG